jgi:hypothetical protein
MMNIMKDGKEGRREFFRKAGRCLALGLTGAGMGFLLWEGKIDPSAPRCRLEGKCAGCPSRRGCAWLRPAPVKRKDAHGGA